MYVDSHCHLTHKQFAGDVESVIQRAKSAKLTRAYCTGGMLGHDQTVLKLCAKHAGFLRPVIGISPHDANRVTVEQKEAIFSLIEKNRSKLAGIGEIGLDFHYFKTEEEQKKQEILFREEIELARTLNLPIIIHSRKAEERVLDILEEVKYHNFAMHCFMVKNSAKRVIDLGGLISLPTIKSKEKKYIIKQFEADKFLCETDSPYLWQGRNEPLNVLSVYNEIAFEKGKKIEEIGEIVLQNVNAFFR